MASLKITFSGPGEKVKLHKAKLLHAIEKTLDSGTFFHGNANERLIRALSTYLKSRYVVLTGSGHDSLLLSLRAVQAETGDVIVPATAYPTAFAVAQSGARIVIADTDISGQLTPETVKQVLTPKTRAIVAVHLYGLCGTIDVLSSFAARNGIALIEDCAQSFGTHYKGKAVGSFGDISCFSFYPTKNLSTVGDGGAISTRSKSYYNFIRAATQYGEKKRYKSIFVSGHTRIPEIQAAVLSEYLAGFAKDAKKRKKVFDGYSAALSSANLGNNIRLLPKTESCDPVPNVFPVLVTKRSKLRRFLSSHGIDTLIHYPLPVHRVAAFKELGYKRGDFPTAEYISNHIMSLPLHTFLEQRHIDYVATTIKNFYAIIHV